MSTTLTPGTAAPDFTGTDQHGNQVSLKDFAGSKLVLYFYPKDDTPGCTKEACNLRDNFENLQNQGYKILGVSIDDVDSHKKFAEKYNLPFSLIADTEKAIVNAYEVYGEKNMFGKKVMSTFRTTFVIDEQGNISEIIKKVKSDDHANQILASK